MKKRSNGCKFMKIFAPKQQQPDFRRGDTALEYYADATGNLRFMNPTAAKRALNRMFTCYLDSPDADDLVQRAEVVTLVNRINELIDYVHRDGSGDDDKAIY